MYRISRIEEKKNPGMKRVEWKTYLFDIRPETASNFN